MDVVDVIAGLAHQYPAKAWDSAAPVGSPDVRCLSEHCDDLRKLLGEQEWCLVAVLPPPLIGSANMDLGLFIEGNPCGH